jgi:hypothetical protein
VGDNSPDFRATNGTGPGEQRADGYRIQVTTGGFAPPTHWDTPAAGTAMPQIDPGVVCQQISYGVVGTAQPLNWGATYSWRIQFFRGASAGPFSDPASFMMTASASASQNGNGSPSAASWRNVGVPIPAGTTVSAAQLLDDVSLLYRWDEPTRLWVQLSSGDVLRGGEGYMAFCPPGTLLDLSTGQVASGDQNFKYSYTPLPAATGQEIVEGKGQNAFVGNHFFANPFNVRIDWNDPNRGGHVNKHPTLVSRTFHRWDGTQYLTYSSQTRSGSANRFIDPFQAVGIVALGDTNANLLTVRDPSFSSSAVPPPTGPTPNEWALQVVAQSNGVPDTENFFGVRLDSEDTWDLADGEEPGHGDSSSQPWVLVWVDHTSWATNPREYTHDFRKTRLNAGEEIVWNFLVDINPQTAVHPDRFVTLTWPNVAQLPLSDWQYFIEDSATGTTTDLSVTPSLQIGPISSPYPLVFRARRTVNFSGTLEVLEAPTGAAPASAAAGQAGVGMMDLEVWAHGEDVRVDKLVVRHEGAGDAAEAAVSLYQGSVRLAGPVSFSGGTAAVFTGLAWLIPDNVAQVVSVVYDFGSAASGTYRAVVFAEETEGVGMISTRTIRPAALQIRGGEVDVSAPAAAGSSGGGGGGCGLLGAEVVLLMAAVAVVRALRERRPRAAAS